MTTQDKAKAAVELLERLKTQIVYHWSNKAMDYVIEDKLFPLLELLRPLAEGTHVMVPVEPTENMRCDGDVRMDDVLMDVDCLSPAVEVYRAMITSAQEQE
jgi:hypothetical protein